MTASDGRQSVSRHEPGWLGADNSGDDDTKRSGGSLPLTADVKLRADLHHIRRQRRPCHGRARLGSLRSSASRWCAEARAAIRLGLGRAGAQSGGGNALPRPATQTVRVTGRSWSRSRSRSRGGLRVEETLHLRTEPLLCQTLARVFQRARNSGSFSRRCWRPGSPRTGVPSHWPSRTPSPPGSLAACSPHGPSGCPCPPRRWPAAGRWLLGPPVG